MIVDNTGPDIDVYSRTAAQLEWVETSLGSGDTLSLPELGIDIPVAEIFRGVSFEISASGPVGYAVVVKAATGFAAEPAGFDVFHRGGRYLLSDMPS